jgi:hypothetical protein
MTTATDPTTTTATNAAAPTGTTAGSTAQPEYAAGEEFKGMSLDQFNARLAKERDAGVAQLLKGLGVEKIDDAKARIAKAAELEKAQLSENEKRDLALKEATTKAARADALEATIAKHAKTQFEGLKSEAMKKYVQTIAGDDPQKRLDAIIAAEESGLFAELAKPAAAETKVEKLASSKAAGTPPPPANGTPQKRPVDMTKAEFAAFEKERNARKSAQK